MNRCQFFNQMVMEQCNGLPNDYQQVEYLWSPSTSGAYIKTGFVPGQRFKTVIRAQIREDNGLIPSGCYNSSGSLQTSYGIAGGASGTMYYRYANPVSNFSTYTWVNIAPFVVAEDVTLTEDWITPLYKVEKSDATYTSTPNNYFPTFNNVAFFLFARNQNGSLLNKGSQKIYWAKFYNSTNTLVRNYIPCYRKSDNKPGMYDTVNNTFNVNAGTGTDFTLGPTV